MFSLWPRRNLLTAMLASIFSIPVRDRTDNRTADNLTLLGQPVPQRKFELGDRVQHIWILNDSRDPRNGFENIDTGTVVGYWWNAADSTANFFADWYKQEWVYVICYTESNGSDQKYCPYLEIGGESDLKPSYSVDTAQPTLSPSPYPSHKFALGQRVQWKFFCEEENKTSPYTGRVIGVRWATWKKIYLYEVAIDSCSDEDFLTTIEELYESELEAAE